MTTNALVEIHHLSQTIERTVAGGEYRDGMLKGLAMAAHVLVGDLQGAEATIDWREDEAEIDRRIREQTS